MNREQLLSLYDRDYARSYDDRFLLSDLTAANSHFERDLLARFIKPGMRWLDVGCGTGYFLGQFPEVDRAGIDISPAMLAEARLRNPSIELRQADFRERHDEWHGKWDFVSCMWYAYGLVDSVDEVISVFKNMSSWTSAAGTLFVPIAEPALIAEIPIPRDVAGKPWTGGVQVDAIVWSYTENLGGSVKTHRHMIAPHVDVLTEAVKQEFASIDVLRYPPVLPYWPAGRSVLIASKKHTE